MISNLVTPPALEPITLDEAKAHLRVEHDLDDQLIESLISSATNSVELTLNRALINQTWVHTFDKFPGVLTCDLQAGVSSITSITYQDTANVQQTLPADVYELTGGTVSGFRLAYGKEWPSVLDHKDSVSVTVVVGYGATRHDVPQAIRQAMLLLIGNWYENRESTVIGTITAQLPHAVDLLLRGYKVPYL